ELKASERYKDLKTRVDGRQWIASNVADAGVRQKLIKDYEDRFDAIGTQRVNDLHASYGTVSGWLEASQLRFGPQAARYCTANDFALAFAWINSVRCDFAGVSFGHIMGMFVTALFLSLG